MKRLVYIFLLSIGVLAGLIYLLPFVMRSSAPSVFNTLQDMQKYADQLDEYPPIDNTTWANPDYTGYLRQLVPTYWDNFTYEFKLASWPLWHAQGFKRLLAKMIKIRENDGYIDRFVLKMTPVKGSAFIIWGDVQGAFHSLVRVLTELKKKGIINEQLEIIKPYVYFVFNGDLINRSPFSLETLSVVLRLMERNGDKVFYIRGNHEDRDHWKNFNLKRNLIIRAPFVSNQEVPLSMEINRFFNTLPLSLYLIGDEDKQNINVVRISHFDRSATELDESTFSGFFERSNDESSMSFKRTELVSFKLSNKIPNSEKKIHVRAIIKGESRSTIYRPTPGLSQLEADKGATAWTILSSPTETYRHLQDFYFDAFAVLDIGKTLNDWRITLYNQDVRELLGFKKVAIYSLITGLREFNLEKEQTGVDRFIQVSKELKAIDKDIRKLEHSCH